MDDNEDQLLAEAWTAGDTKAGDKLIRRHQPVLTRYFITHVPYRDSADLCQQTWLQCTRSIKENKYRHEGSFRAFLMKIAYYTLLHFYRKKRRHFDKIDPMTHSVAELSGPGAFTALVNEVEHERIRWALRQLPLQLHDALFFYYWEEMSAREVAEILDVNPNTLRGRLRSARQRLQDILDDAGGLE